MANRQNLNLSLAPDVVAAIRARSREVGEPISRIVDALARRGLGLPDPVPILPTVPLASTGTDGGR
jgi:hypothetical protein